MVDIFLCSRQVLLNNPAAVRGFPLQCMQAVNDQDQHKAVSMSCVQVTTRLPKSKAVMFTFRTYMRPLRVLEERTEVMQRLLAAFTALPDDVVSLCVSVLCRVVAPCRSCSFCWQHSQSCQEDVGSPRETVSFVVFHCE